MKIIGLLGGMSWESTSEYYRILNEMTREKLGGLHSAKIIIHSFDFSEIAEMQHSNRWNDLENMLISAAVGLEKSGATCIVICTNLMHKVAGKIEQAVSIPLIHIADAVAVKIKHDGIRKVGLLGAKYTMKESFYVDKLKTHGIETIIPDEKGCEMVHEMIYDELCQGKFTDSAKVKLKSIISNLRDNGAEGVILGCTELPMLLSQDESDVRLYDSMMLHASLAFDFSFSTNSNYKFN